MNFVTLQCPLCRGTIQIDAAAAGQQVACPHCRETIQAPPAETIARLTPPPVGPPAMPSNVSAPPAAPFSHVPIELVSLACPACGGIFQVPPSASGLQLPCPTCRQVVTIPDAAAVSPAKSAPATTRAVSPPKTSAIPAKETGLPSVTTPPRAANAASGVETLLPPGAALAGGITGEQLSLPAMPQPITAPSSAGMPTGQLHAPDAEAGVVAVKERPRVLGEGADEFEIARLSSAEKARRRGVRNAILFILGLAGLLAAAIYLSR